MATTEKQLEYRGDIQAGVGLGRTLAFVTKHPQQQPMALYWLDCEKIELTETPLPQGGVAIVADETQLYIAGDDRCIYRVEAKPPGKKSGAAVGKPLAAEFEHDIVRLVLLADNRLGVATGKEVIILSRDKGKRVQTIELGENITAIAVDPTGAWLAVGTQKGEVAIYTCEAEDEEAKTGNEFVLSESDKLHDGAVTSLLFEPEELRFFSAGADHQLLLTHARGKLEPEDRGRGYNHDDRVTAMISGVTERIYTGGRDSVVKNWLRGGKARPATLRDGIAMVVDLTLVEVHKRTHLASLCEDNSVRLLLIDAAGKFGDITHKFFDAYALARSELGQSTASRREAALKTLAEYNDVRSIEIIAKQIENDDDHKLRLLATNLLGDSGHARSVKLLEATLKHRDEAVRLASLAGLRKLVGEDNLEPLELALAVGKADVGSAAVEHLRELASEDDRAMAKLIEALSFEPVEVRKSALLALETLHPKDSPVANLQALNSPFADLRRLSLVRLLHRGLQDHAEVASALRRRMEDSDANVRGTAFLISLLTRPSLALALRAKDAAVHRRLFELETYSEDGGGKKDPPKQPKAPKAKLTAHEMVPVLQATASLALDTCLLGARCLALLGDPRAFGLLLQLSREEDAPARVEVCRSLAALADSQSARRLRSMLRDGAPEVRDGAFSALTEIHAKEPLEAAEAGLNAQHQDVGRRGLQLLIKRLKKKKPKQGDQGWNLLLRALDSEHASVRSEAFKATINLEVDGGGVKTLRYVLRSVREDIRREVLNEITGQFREPWAKELLFELFNDPAGGIRSEAFSLPTTKQRAVILNHIRSR